MFQEHGILEGGREGGREGSSRWVFSYLGQQDCVCYMHLINQYLHIAKLCLELHVHNVQVTVYM